MQNTLSNVVLIEHKVTDNNKENFFNVYASRVDTLRLKLCIP
jgi:hypothetical protein